MALADAPQVDQTAGRKQVQTTEAHSVIDTSADVEMVAIAGGSKLKETDEDKWKKVYKDDVITEDTTEYI